MTNLPSGTVTFLFTDIEGSTKLSQQYPDAMPVLLARHNQILHQTIEGHNGYVFQVVGDSFAEAWLIFMLEMGVLGAIMLYYARDSSRNRILVLTVSILELIRGAGGDLLWMFRGWPPANYIPFMILHMIIAGTGLFFLRQESTGN